MATIVFADTTGRYDGRALEREPLGGTESSVIRLAQALARRGHAVTAYTHCEAAIEHAGVAWRPLHGPRPRGCDLYVACQRPKLLGFAKDARRRAIWVLGQANHLKHYKQIWRMWLYRPAPVLMSRHQVSIYSPFLPRCDPHIVLPLGLPDDVRGEHPRPPPLPRAIFASNPQRHLGRLVEIWARAIRPRVPGAVLDVFGIHELRGESDPWRAWEGIVLPAGLSDDAKASVRIHPTVPRPELLDAMRRARVMLYLGHKVEAFCLSLAEAQALGVPAVIAPVAALPERVIDSVTGFHHADAEAFADAAVRLLTDDDLWRSQHAACLRHQRGIGWDEYARLFETILLGDLVGCDIPPLSRARAAAFEAE